MKYFIFIFLFSCSVGKRNEYHINESIIFDIKINDSIYDCVFDTGASYLYIDSVFAKKKYSFKRKKDFFIKGISELKTKVEVVSDTIIFGIENEKFNSNRNFIFNMKNINENNIKFVLGNYYFQKTKIFINNNKIKIINDDSLFDYSEYKKSNFEFIKGDMIIKSDAFLDNKNFHKINLLIDTGYVGQLLITNDTLIKKYIVNNIKKKISYYTEWHGVGGKPNGFRYKMKKLKLFDNNIYNIFVECNNPKNESKDMNDYDGIIGHGLLKKFNIIIDYQNKIIYSKPNSNFNIDYKHPRLGFTPFLKSENKTKYLLVRSIVKNSPAEKSGLKLNDKIIELNNIKIENKYNENNIKKNRIYLKLIREKDTMLINYKLSKLL
jgi:predicted aspartyl protease